VTNKSAPSKRAILYAQIRAFEKRLTRSARKAGTLESCQHITLAMAISRNPKSDPKRRRRRKKYRRCTPIMRELDDKDWVRIAEAGTLKKGLQAALVQFFRKRKNKPASGKQIDALLGYPHDRKIHFTPRHTGGLNDALRDASLPYRLLVTVRAWGRAKSRILYCFFAVT
jgi:hypothetical protein